MENIEQRKYLDKLDELLSLRESKKDSMRQLNRTIKDGIKTVGCLPERWYVRTPSESVKKYLKDKYDKKVEYSDESMIGLGELHGQFAFIPHDVDYSWEISQDEFDYAITLMKNKTEL